MLDGTARVVSAKLAIPRLSPLHLHRPRLLAALERDAAPVVLISAPAGHGKTTMLAEFAATRRGQVAWLSLDSTDDETRLWSGVLAALCRCSAVGPDDPLQSLAVPGSPTADTAFVAAVDGALRALPHPVTLVLDDVHEPAASARVVIEHLVRWLPDTVRLILLTRRDPRLSLGRLRLDGRLHELRSTDLAMDAGEVDVLLQKLGVRLTAAQLEVLLEQTGGWPAGVRLAARSLAEGDDADAYLADLAGNDRAIADYLVTEVLARLPESTVDVLHAVSICDQLPASLVAALSGTEDGVAELDALEHGSGLVTAYGPGRAQYRVHPLLRAHMQASLRRTRPQRVTELHRRAATWFLDHGLPAEAVRHLVAARDGSGVVALLREKGVDLVEGGHSGAVLTALEAVPASGDVVLLAVLALARLGRGELDAARHAIERAGTLPTDDEQTAATLAFARTRLSLTEDRLFHAGGAESVGFAGLRGTWSDRLLAAESAIAADRADEAERLIRPVLDDPRIDDFGRARATAVLAAATGLRGGFEEMADLAHTATLLGAGTGRWEDTDGAALAAVLSGYAALMRCRPEQTVAELARADGYAARMGAAVVLTPLIDALRAAARFDLGEREPAADLMHRARTATVVDRARTEQVALVAMLGHRMAVQLGRREEAQSVVSWVGARLEGTAELAVMRAAGPAGISRFDAAERLLRPVLDDVVPSALTWTGVEARLLDCAIALATGQQARAERSLAAALRTAHDIGVLRPLVTVPAAVADLMRARLAVLGDLRDLVSAALDERGRRGTAGLPALTEREHAVLLHLPSLHPLAEIARELGVSPNTVKTHVKALYAKLGAVSRREAVDAAARLGLIRDISPTAGDGPTRS